MSQPTGDFIHVRVSTAEKRAIVAAAKRQDLTVSQLIRHALRRARSASNQAAA